MPVTHCLKLAALATCLAIASGHRPRVARRLLAVYWVSRPIVLGNISTPHPRGGYTMQHYLPAGVPKGDLDFPNTGAR